MNKHILSILVLALASLACLSTAMVDVGSGGSATPPLTAIAEEDPAGAVFQIPAEWTDPTATRSPQCALVDVAQSLHLRAEPNEKGKVLGYLKAGERVTVLAYGDWWKIKTGAGKIGYSNADYLVAEECEP